MSATDTLRVLYGRPMPSLSAGFGWPVESALTAVTVGRLVLVPVIIASFIVSPPITTAALLLFITADVYDGVIARRHKADGSARRALDSIVDRIAIDACLLAACVSGALPLPILCAFLARDLYLTFLCHGMMAERRVAIKADWLYRSLNLGVAAWAIAIPFISSAVRVGFAVSLLALSVIVAADLVRAVRIVRCAPPDFRNVVVDAGWLRRLSPEAIHAGLSCPLQR